MFQFQCPNGHLLEGEESQAGQQCHCPHCQILFIIPQPLGSVPMPEQSAGPEQAFPSMIGPPGSAQQAGPGPGPAADPMAPVSPAGSGFSLQQQQQAPNEPAIYHIPCPNGHELEVPEDMLKQEVICPFCETQFYLRMKDSVEYKKHKQEEIDKKDRKAGKAWLHWSIAIAVIVVLGLIGMIVMSSQS